MKIYICKEMQVCVSVNTSMANDKNVFLTDVIILENECGGGK